MGRTHAEKKKGRSRYGIKWKLYAILIVFVAASASIIWLFQFRLLSYFYQNNKFNELKNTALVITQELNDKEFSWGIVEEHSEKYAEDIWISRVEGEEFVFLYSPPQSDDVVNRHVNSTYGDLYKKTEKNGDTYIAIVSDISFRGDKVIPITDNSGQPEMVPILLNGADDQMAIYVTVSNVGDEKYMIVQTTDIAPDASITKTMRIQFFWIFLALAIVSLIAAGIMSKIITKPIVKMNASAKRLAEGEYGADFTVSGYREIDELADTLNYASHELAKTDKLQKELISNVSHDLRTPLTMIKGYGEVMRDIPGENTPENIQIIIDETTRLTELVNDMLDLSKIQSGTRKPEMQAFSLTQTVRDTMQRYERLTMQNGYRIEFDGKDEIYVSADRGMILQVIYNLINNAINYTGEDKFVSVKQTAEGDYVRISVTDTGEGIAESELDKIWDRYYKVDKVHKRATVGTGLGLSIVKQVLDVHKARYGVESREGEGSTFWFELEIYGDSEKSAPLTDYIEADYEIQESKDNEKDIT